MIITLQPNVIDLKGHTEIDTLNVSGLSTFANDILLQIRLFILETQTLQLDSPLLIQYLLKLMVLRSYESIRR